MNYEEQEQHLLLLSSQIGEMRNIEMQCTGMCKFASQGS